MITFVIRHYLLNNQKFLIMKAKSIIFALAFVAVSVTSFTSCSPQNIDDIHADQNIDKDSIKKIPSRG